MAVAMEVKAPECVAIKGAKETSMRSDNVNSKGRRVLWAAVLALGASFAASADDTVNFATIAMGALPAGALDDTAIAGYVGANSVTDPVSGVVATGYSSGTRGSGYSSNNLSLYRRNQPNDHGIGVCTDAEGGSTGCAPADGNGDVNELSNQQTYELIVLTRPAQKEWVSVQLSSLDDNTNVANPLDDENGVLYAGDSATDPGQWTKVADLKGDDAAREPTIIIPDPLKGKAYLIFEPYHAADAGLGNNDFLVWQATVKPVLLECPGTGTPGYWKNHAEAWPAGITIGGVYFTKQQAIDIMLVTLRGDKTWTMFNALVSAKLNVLIGCDCEDEFVDISDTIADADLWMASHHIGTGVAGNSDAWADGEPLYETLNDYNNGLLCAPHRD
jgi:hypothetical protein